MQQKEIWKMFLAIDTLTLRSTRVPEYSLGSLLASATGTACGCHLWRQHFRFPLKRYSNVHRCPFSGIWVSFRRRSLHKGELDALPIQNSSARFVVFPVPRFRLCHRVLPSVGELRQGMASVFCRYLFFYRFRTTLGG